MSPEWAVCVRKFQFDPAVRVAVLGVTAEGSWDRRKTGATALDSR